MRLTCTEIDPYGLEHRETLPEKSKPASKKEEKERDSSQGGGNREKRGKSKFKKPAPPEHTCGACGDKKASTKIVVDGREQWICGDCLRKKGQKDKQAENPDSPGHFCEECAKLGIEDKPAVRKVLMNGRERWLCESCMQAEGYSLARRL